MSTIRKCDRCGGLDEDPTTESASTTSRIWIPASLDDDTQLATDSVQRDVCKGCLDGLRWCWQRHQYRVVETP